MSEVSSDRKRGNSRPNVKRRGSTYTYYVYVTDADGRRRQHSKGGFRTQRAAEDARIEALSALANAAYVKAGADRLLAAFLIDEWLPSRRPPVLEESTWHSYERYIRLHVIPHIGAIHLQRLSPVDLNRLYRHLLEAGRRPPAPRSQRPPEVYERAVELRAGGHSYEAVARRSAGGVRRRARADEACRRRADPPRSTNGDRGSSRRWTVGSDRSLHPHDHPCRAQGRAALEPRGPQRRRRRHSPVCRSGPVVTTEGVDRRATAGLPRLLRRQPATCRRGSSSPRPAAGGASASGFAGTTSTSTAARPSSARQVTAIDHEVIVKEVPEDQAGAPHPARHRHARHAPSTQGRAGRAPAPPRVRRTTTTGYVFCQWDGTPYHPERFSREFDRKQDYFNRDHPDSPLPAITLHGLRHTWATLALTRWHRHQDRQRAPQPQQHAHHARDLHPRHAAHAE